MSSYTYIYTFYIYLIMHYIISVLPTCMCHQPQTDRQTHRTTTVTLRRRVGAKRGLWTLDWTNGLDCGLRFGLDFGLMHRTMTTISNNKLCCVIDN